MIVTDPTKLQAIRDREEDIMKERIDMMIKAGANVVLTAKGIDDMCMKYLVEAGCIGCRRVKKDDMKRIAKVTGGQIIVSLANMEGNESFDAKMLGSCDSVYEERCGDNELLIFEGCGSMRAGACLEHVCLCLCLCLYVCVCVCVSIYVYASSAVSGIVFCTWQ